MNNWRVIHIRGEDLEEKTALLYEDYQDILAGTTFNTDGSCLCYLQGQLTEDLKQKIQQFGLLVLSDQEVQNENWTQSCPELFEVIDFEKISIIPVSDTERAKQTSLNPDRDILIIPGTGFGTGHHASTKNLIRMLHRQEIFDLQPKRVLDAGSGSGILALVAAKLYKSQVDAYELDLLACENAADNVAINSMQEKIKIIPESVHLAQSSYNLIIANLYAELLDMLCTHLVSLSSEKSIFLLSGIRSDLMPSIKAKYESHGLCTIEQCIEDGWASLLLLKN